MFFKKLNLLNKELENNQSEDEREINDIYASSDVISISYICHITTESINKSSIIYETVENKLIALDHIIICGNTQNFIDFIKPLRAKHLPKAKCPTIVILSKEVPDDKLWSTISFFEQIYIVEGDPMKKEDLQRAGIKNATKVVILSPSIEEIFKNKIVDTFSKKQARKLTKEEEDLLDSKTIFKYNMISKLKKDIFIVIELINPKNVSFLYNKGRHQNDEYLFIKNGMKIDGTASFTSGEVYFSSIMDNLLVQAYYNKSLLAVLKKIILGEDQSIYKKPPLSRYKNLISSNLYLIDNPFDSDNKIRDYITKKKTINYYRLNNNFNENLECLNSPFIGLTDSKIENFKINNDNKDSESYQSNKIKYFELFNFLLNKGVLLIGIYRYIDSTLISKTQQQTIHFDKKSSNFYFVYTSPDKDEIVDYKDKLFVLSQIYPERLLETLDFPIFNNTKLEVNPFKNHIASNLKKVEEKKEIKTFEVIDKTGINKIKEINSYLKEIQEGSELLKNKLVDLHHNIELNIYKEVNKKLSNLHGEISSNKLYCVKEDNSDIKSISNKSTNKILPDVLANDNYSNISNYISPNTSIKGVDTRKDKRTKSVSTSKFISKDNRANSIYIKDNNKLSNKNSTSTTKINENIKIKPKISILKRPAYVKNQTIESQNQNTDNKINFKFNNVLKYENIDKINESFNEANESKNNSKTPILKFSTMKIKTFDNNKNLSDESNKTKSYEKLSIKSKSSKSTKKTKSFNNSSDNSSNSSLDNNLMQEYKNIKNI